MKPVTLQMSHHNSSYALPMLTLFLLVPSV